MKKEIVGDVKNCLTVIILESDMILEKENLSERARKGVQKIKDKGWEINKTVGKLIAEVIEV